jgi:hypothetical protein
MWCGPRPIFTARSCILQRFGHSIEKSRHRGVTGYMNHATTPVIAVSMQRSFFDVTKVTQGGVRAQRWAIAAERLIVTFHGPQSRVE